MSYFMQLKRDVVDFEEVMDNNNYWEFAKPENVLGNFLEWAREYYADPSGVESKESIKQRISELSHWSFIFYTCKPEDITLLESSFDSENGYECNWCAFRVHGVGFEIDFANCTTSRNTAYDAIENKAV